MNLRAGVDLLRAQRSAYAHHLTPFTAFPSQPGGRPAFGSTRLAHAAALEDEPTNDAQRGANGATSGAGPSRARRAPGDDYRFPSSGSHGGRPSPYEILGLERSASEGEIKAAYYRLALILHPDSSHPSASSDHFALLNKAYKLLSAPGPRGSYLTTGYGWTGNLHVDPASQSSEDAIMREAIRRARARGAGEWGGRGFRDSDANGWGYQHTYGAYRRDPNTGSWEPYHADGHAHGGGEALYMSNEKFFLMIALLAGVVAWVQWARAGSAADSSRMMLVDRHLDATRALAEAHKDAAEHGAVRRDMIRRRVRENAVMEEINRLRAGEARTGHGEVLASGPPGSAVPPPPHPPSASGIADGRGPTAQGP